jgi:hypothetical protein
LNRFTSTDKWLAHPVPQLIHQVIQLRENSLATQKLLLLLIAERNTRLLLPRKLWSKLLQMPIMTRLLLL